MERTVAMNGKRGAGAMVARGALVRLCAMALVYASASMLLEVTVASLEADMAVAASTFSLIVTVVLLAALVISEIHAYRAVVAAGDVEPEMGDKVLLAATLWFGGGLPMCIVSVVRQLTGFVQIADPQVVYVQLGLSVVLMLLSWLRFARDLR